MPSIGKLRNTRSTSGAAIRFARPMCASTSSSAEGRRLVLAAASIGPDTYPPAPNTTSGRTRPMIRRQASGAPPARHMARSSSGEGRRGRPLAAKRWNG